MPRTITEAGVTVCQHGNTGYYHDEDFASTVAEESWTPRHGVDLDVDLRQSWAAYFSATIL